tara:strand:+ start:526 stop:1128 length:603 start_codon:yes stop_codon:yes gene_type:complete
MLVKKKIINDIRLNPKMGKIIFDDVRMFREVLMNVTLPEYDKGNLSIKDTRYLARNVYGSIHDLPKLNTGWISKKAFMHLSLPPHERPKGVRTVKEHYMVPGSWLLFLCRNQEYVTDKKKFVWFCNQMSRTTTVLNTENDELSKFTLPGGKFKLGITERYEKLGIELFYFDSYHGSSWPKDDLIIDDIFLNYQKKYLLQE